MHGEDEGVLVPRNPVVNGVGVLRPHAQPGPEPQDALAFQLRPDTDGPLRVGGEHFWGEPPVHAHVLVGRADHYRAPEGTGDAEQGDGEDIGGDALQEHHLALVGEDGDVRTELRRELADAEPGGEHGLAAFQRPASADDGIALAGGLHFRNPFPGEQRAAEPDEAFAEREHQVQGIDVAVHVGPDPSGNFRAEGDLGQHAFKFLAGKHGGRVRAVLGFSPELFDELGARLKLGFPEAGDDPARGRVARIDAGQFLQLRRQLAVGPRGGEAPAHELRAAERLGLAPDQAHVGPGSAGEGGDGIHKAGLHAPFRQPVPDGGPGYAAAHDDDVE